MSTARSTPRAGLQRQQDAMVTVRHGEPVTTTLVVAEHTGVLHASAIRLVREHLPDFEQFGLVRFGIVPRPDGQHGGGDVEFAILNERQTTLLFTYMRNTPKTRAIKMAFVKAFFGMADELQRLKTMRAEPAWSAARIETRREFVNVTDMLQEVRADAGKTSAPHHFSNEARLIRFAMTGSDSAKWDRDALDKADLKLLGKVERLDMRLIARDVPFADRKAACRTLVLEARGMLLTGARA